MRPLSGILALLLAVFGVSLAARTGAQGAGPGPRRPQLRWEVTQERVVRCAVFSPDGSTLVTGGNDNLVKLFDARTGQLQRTLTGHTDRIYSLAYTPDGKLLATTSGDKSIRLWNPATGALVRTLQGHTDKVRTAAFSPDGKWLATGAEDKTVRLWDPATGKPVRTLTGHGDMVWTVAWTPDGATLASSSADKTVRLWDPATGALKRTLTGHTNEVWSMAFSPDGATLATASLDYLVKLWDVATGAQRRSYPEGGPVLALAFSPDGSTLVTTTYTIEGTQITGGEIRLRSARYGTPYAVLRGAKGPVMAVTISRDGTQLAAVSGYESNDGNQPGQTRVWDFRGVAEAVNIQDRTPTLALQVGHRRDVAGVAYSRDGNFLASGDRMLPSTIKLWDPRTGQLLRTLSGRQVGVSSLAFSPDGTLLASGGTNEVVSVWDPRTGDIRLVLPGHGGPVRDVAFSPDGKWLVSACEDGKLRLWNPLTGALLREWAAHEGGTRAARFSPDGKWLASAGADRAVRIWDPQTGAPLRALPGHVGAVNDLAFSGDGSRLASGSDDHSVQVWDTATGTALRKLEGHPQPVNGVDLSPDGKLVASTCGSLNGPNPTGELRLWSVETGTALKTVPTGTHFVARTVFSPDAATVAVGVGSISLGEVRLYNSTSGELRRALTGTRESLESLALSPDGKTVVGGSGDVSAGVVHAWNLETGELRQTLEAGDSQVTSTVFSPDGRRLIVGAWDGKVRIWDTTAALGNWRLVNTLNSGPASLHTLLALTADGRTLATGSLEPTGGGMVKLWDLDTGTERRVLPGMETGVNALGISPDGRLVAAGGDDRKVRVWDGGTGQLLATLTGHAGPILSLAFSPDGARLATSSLQPSTGDGEIWLWNTRTGMREQAIGGNLLARAVAFSPDGNLLAGEVLDFDGGKLRSGLRLWNPRTGAARITLPAFDASVTGLAFSRDGGRLITGSEDNTLRLWDLRKERLLASLIALPPGEASKPLQAGAKPLFAGAKDLVPDDYLVFTPEGYYTGSAGADRYVRFMLGDDLFPAESFQDKFSRADLVRQALAGADLPAVSQFRGAYPPVIGFTAPANGSKIAGQQLTLNLEASDDSAVERVDIFVNGMRVEAKPLFGGAKPLMVGAKPLMLGAKLVPAQHRNIRPVAVAVPLPAGDAEIRVQAIAYDEDGLRSPREEVLFTRDKAASASGKLLGLCVGVSAYRDSRLNLRYADKDANALKETLNRQRGLYSGAEVAALTNAGATRDGVRKALDDLISRTGRADTAVVFLSGHGWRSQEGQFYFATHEVDTSGIVASSLPWTDVIDRLKRLSEKSRRVVVLLDACHSGSAATNEELVKAVLAANTGVIVFASSKGSEFSLESPELEHGVFTKALLEAIGGKAAPAGEKNVTILDFLSYVARRVKALTNDTQHPWIPFLQDFDPETALVALESP